MDDPRQQDLPWTLRAPAPSEWAIDAYVAGEASPEQIARIEQHLAAHPEFQAVLDGRRAGFDALPMANPQAMRARILQAAEARPAAVTAPPRRDWLRWLFGGGALAAAAAAVFLMVRPTEPVSGVPDRVVAKSTSVAMTVFRARDGKVEALVNGDRVQTGDQLRFKPDLSKVDAEGKGHVLVLGVPAQGAPFGYAPAGATRSIPAAALDAEGLFTGSAQLDAAVGVEWAHLIWCPAPFEARALTVTTPERITPPEGCRTTAFKLDKR